MGDAKGITAQHRKQDRPGGGGKNADAGAKPVTQNSKDGGDTKRTAQGNPCPQAIGGELVADRGGRVDQGDVLDIGKGVADGVNIGGVAKPDDVRSAGMQASDFG